MSDFGERLRRIRREKNVTQRQLAALLKLRESSYISNLETGVIGNPRLETVYKIAAALDVQFSEFTGEVGGDVERAIMWSALDDEDRRTLIRVYRAMLAHPRERT